ncbi:cytochrome p450 [Moniliophthora roreri MCA 2997]|uniref:Cytochrome p450 n=2 Tax=Moniliophthora roreri TaxID=221103 RepID=V2WKR0_MONRO|nr:cytochrome p450 [Moniliophthora roreri MCA 2997]
MDWKDMHPSQIVYVAISVFLLRAVIRKAYSLVKAFWVIRTCPGRYLTLFNPHLLTTNAVAPFFPRQGQFGHYPTTFDFYAKHGSTCLSTVVLSDSTLVYWTCDAEAFKVVSGEVGGIYEKDMAVYHSWTGPGFNFLGDNVIGSHGKTWKRHRMIANPAFSESNISLVWRETIRVLNEWTTSVERSAVDGWFELDAFEELKQLTTLVFASAAFGRRDPWKPAEGDTSTNSLSYLLSTAEQFVVAKILIPEWVYRLTDNFYVPGLSPLLNLTKTIYQALSEQILEIISASRANLLEKKDSDGALLKAFIEANTNFESDSLNGVDRLSQKHLTDQELLANMFIFMIAGHETTAATVSFALIYLALYPEMQDKVFSEVCQVWPNGVPNTVEDADNRRTYPKLTYTTAFVNETLRHHPAGSRLGRVVLEDTTLPARRFHRTAGDSYETQPYTIPIPSGSKILLDFGALHTNPLYWGDDAAEFNPDRFVDTESYRWPREAFMPFSYGPRSCIGQRFAMTESVSMLAHMVRKFRVVVPEDLVGRPLEDQKRVLLQWKPQLANIPVNARIRLYRRV